MSLIAKFFRILAIPDCPEVEMLAMSQLDHDLNDLTEAEMLEVFASDETKGYPDIAEKEKVYIAGLAEYIYHKAGKTPPDWVYSKEFYLPNKQYTDGIEMLSKDFNTNSLKQVCDEEVLPEFKERNYMITEVLTAM